MKTSKNSNYSQTHKDRGKVKGILLFLVQCLLPIFIKTLAAIIVSQGSHKKTESWGELQGHLEPFHSIFWHFYRKSR